MSIVIQYIYKANNICDKSKQSDIDLHIIKYLCLTLNVFKYLDKIMLINILNKASEYGYLKIVCQLLENKHIDPSYNNNEAIEIASRNGHIKAVNRLSEDKRVNRITPK